MRHLLPLLFLGIFSLLSRADTKVFLDSDTDGTSGKIIVKEWYISPQKLDQLPAYDPAVASPPVTIADAVKIARAEVDRNVEAKSIITLDSLELDQIDKGNSGETISSFVFSKPSGKWYYKITYSIERPDPKTGVYTYPFPVYVLMDRSLAQYRERPQTKEEIDQDQQMGDDIKKAVLKDAAKGK